ncbi:MAG: GNAT family N-acetyltransferase [Alphaproteobacteria bacterium]
MNKLASEITLVDAPKERFEWLSDLPEDLFAVDNYSDEESSVFEDTNNNDEMNFTFDDIISYDMHNKNNKKVGNCEVSIHKNKKSPRGDEQVYPNSWFVDEFSDQLKPYMEIVGFGTVGGDDENRRKGLGREALKAIYNFSIENECAGRMEAHATFGAGGFYEACGFKHLNNKNRTQYIEEGYHNNDGIKFFDPNDNIAMTKLTKIKGDNAERIASVRERQSEKKEGDISFVQKPVDMSKVDFYTLKMMQETKGKRK